MHLSVCSNCPTILLLVADGVMGTLWHILLIGNLFFCPVSAMLGFFTSLPKVSLICLASYSFLSLFVSLAAMSLHDKSPGRLAKILMPLGLKLIARAGRKGDKEHCVSRKTISGHLICLFALLTVIVCLAIITLPMWDGQFSSKCHWTVPFQSTHTFSVFHVVTFHLFYLLTKTHSLRETLKCVPKHMCQQKPHNGVFLQRRNTISSLSSHLSLSKQRKGHTVFKIKFSQSVKNLLWWPAKHNLRSLHLY